MHAVMVFGEPHEVVKILKEFNGSKIDQGPVESPDRDSILSLLQDEGPMVFGDIAEYLPHITKGRLRALLATMKGAATRDRDGLWHA
jgi:hypothetical protein